MNENSAKVHLKLIEKADRISGIQKRVEKNYVLELVRNVLIIPGWSA